jgi:type II secretory pathway pseudopilin PulG
MMQHATTRRPKPSEEGFMLVAVIFMVALLMITLSVALPKISKQIQRDHELETMNRGKQYFRAVRMYYKKFGRYPPNLDALVKPTNKIRFLRKKYSDPTTGKEDWKPVFYGQNKAPTAMGFFGKPLTGSSMGGAGTGINGLSNGTSSTSGSSLFGSGSSGSFGSTSGFGSTGQPSQDTSSTNTQQTSDPNNPSTSTDPNNPSSGSGGSTSGGSSSSGSTFGSNSGSTFGSSSGTGLSGQTFGGAGIIGFSPNSPKQSIMVYKTKKHYNEWEFVYDPIAEQMMQSGAANAGGAINGLSSSSSSGSSSFGNSSNSSFGNSGSSSGTSTTTTQ